MTFPVSPDVRTANNLTRINQLKVLIIGTAEIVAYQRSPAV